MGKKLIDLTGQKFGKLTVIKRAETPDGKNKNTYWLCKCECGNEKVLQAGNLTSPRGTKSCGCAPRKLELIGQRFEKLVVIKYLGNDKYQNTTWQCQCDCGNISVVKGTALKQGKVKSCGCLRREHLDIVGQRFGKLLAIKFIKTIHERSFWECLCDCGNSIEVSLNCLQQGSTKSCGCGQKGKGSIGKTNASFNALYAHYKRNAQKRNISFSLCVEEFKKLTEQQCFYCGRKPSKYFKVNETDGSYLYNGIDRVDNNCGYETNNVVTCCSDCNKGKMIKTQQEFLSWIERVYKHSILHETE